MAPEIHQDNRIDNWCYLWMAMFMAVGFALLAIVDNFLGHLVVTGFGVAIVAALVVALLYSKWKKSINERRVVYVILLVSIVIRICYVLSTAQTEYDNAEFEIFRDVHTNLALPDSYQPLFYVASAAIYNFVGMFRVTQNYALDSVRLVNEYLGIVASIAVYYILCELEANDTAIYLCTALTAFLPGMVVIGGEITPVMALTALLTMTLLFLSRWNNYTDGYNFLLMSISFGLAVMVDNAALLLLPVILTLVLINLVRTIKRHNAVNILTTSIQTVVGVVGWVVLSFAYPVWNYTQGKDTGLLKLLGDLGRAPSGTDLHTRFLSFSLSELMNVFADPARDKNAWAYIIKTSLFGADTGEGAVLDEMVLRIFVLLALAVAVAAAAMVICDLFSRMDAKKKVNIWAFAALLAVMIGYYVLRSIADPAAESMAFRVVPYMAIPAFSLYAVGVRVMSVKKKLNFVAGILYFLMTTVTFAYCLCCAAYGLVFLR